MSNPANEAADKIRYRVEKISRDFEDNLTLGHKSPCGASTMSRGRSIRFARAFGN